MKQASQQPESKNNQASGPFFQPQLTVNTPGDAYEQEADEVADSVMRMQEGDAPIVQRMPLTPVGDVQRKCANCEQEEEQAQRKETGSDSAGGKAAPGIVSDVLSSGAGRPMEAPTRQFMESRFGQDFSNVRIHTDSRAADSASAIQAKAYTSGRDIVFGAGQYQPENSSGKRLLAHELAHVGQQGGGVKRDTVLPEVRVSLSRRERERRLRSAGWVKKNIEIVLRDFRGEPLTQHHAFLIFDAAGVATQYTGGDVNHGSLFINDTWLKPNGTLRVMLVSTGNPSLVPEGIIHYTLPQRGSLRLEVEHTRREITVSSSSSQEAAEEVGATGTAGIDFEVFSVGGEVSSTSSRSQGSTLGAQWNVAMPGSSLTIRQL